MGSGSFLALAKEGGDRLHATSLAVGGVPLQTCPGLPSRGHVLQWGRIVVCLYLPCVLHHLITYCLLEQF